MRLRRAGELQMVMRFLILAWVLFVTWPTMFWEGWRA